MHTIKPWFRQPEYSIDVTRAVFDALCASARERDYELTRAAINAWAYERDRWTGIDLTGAPGYGDDDSLFGVLSASGDVMSNRSIPWINKINSSIDVVTDKILQGLPTLSVRAANAPYELRRLLDMRSAALTSTLAGEQAEGALYLFVRDALIKRIGFLRCQFMHGRLQLQRLHPWQVFYDDRDVEHGEMSQVHVAYLVDRDEWLSWYRGVKARDSDGQSMRIPDHAARIRQIEELPPAYDLLPSSDEFSVRWLGARRWLRDRSPALSDQIRVVWSWKRSWRAGEATGRVVCSVIGDTTQTSSVVALDMPFARDTLPVVWWSPWQADTGITGIALAEKLLGAQLATDRTLFKLQRLQDKYGHHKWGVQKGQLTDETAKALLASGIHVFEFDGEVPELIPPMSLNPSDVQWLNFVLDRPASEQGVNPGLTEGRSQLGANASGAARVEEVFRTLDRQKGVRDAFRRGFRRLGAEVNNAIDDALALDPKFSARWRAKDATAFREQPWAELTLPNGNYWIDIDERGVLGTTRAGQIQKALELHAGGHLNDDSLRELLYSSPDLAAAGAREIAPRRAIERHLEILLDPKSTDDELARAQPTEDMDLEDAVFLVTAEINRAIQLDAEPQTLDRLRSYLLACNRVLASLQPAVAPQPAAIEPLP